MEHAYPHLVPVETALVIANVLPSGSAFGVRMDNGENCYIPVNVATATHITVGMEVTAKLVPNRFPDKAERTPWLTVFLSRNPSPVKESVPVQYAMPYEQFDIEPSVPAEPTMADKVRVTMRKGGVWTVSSLYSELVPGKVRTDGLTEYNAISAAVRAMYARGECAKFQLWRSSDQSKASREWFTCHPDRADVDEWEEQ